MTEKVKLNGKNAHPIYQQLTTVPGADGKAGKISWNFEKFVLARDGSVAARFAPTTNPDDPALVAAIEAELAK